MFLGREKDVRRGGADEKRRSRQSD